MKTPTFRDLLKLAVLAAAAQVIPPAFAQPGPSLPSPLVPSWYQSDRVVGRRPMGRSSRPPTRR